MGQPPDPHRDPHNEMCGKSQRAPERRLCLLSGIFAPFFCLHDLRHEAAHRLCCLVLLLPCSVGVGAESESGVIVAEHTADGFDVHAILQCQRCEGMPIGYNCDNTDKSSNIKGLRIFKCSFSMIFGARKPSKRGCRILRGNTCDNTLAATSRFSRQESTSSIFLLSKPPCV